MRIRIGSLLFGAALLGCAASHGSSDVTREALVSAAEQSCIEGAVQACSSPGGACEASASAWSTCLGASGCTDETGALDETCAVDRCAAEGVAYESCLNERCAPLADCAAAPDAGDPAPEPSGFCEAEQTACFDAGGPCAAEVSAWSACGSTAGCISGDGTLDLACFEAVCPTENVALGSCIVGSCEDLASCLGIAAADPSTPSMPSMPSTPTAPTVPCEAEIEACYGAGAPCESVVTTLATCLNDRGCLADGIVDEVCAFDQCPAEVSGYNTCLTTDIACEPLLTCGGAVTAPEPPPSEPLPPSACETSQAVCFGEGGACQTDAEAFLLCIDREGCLDPNGVLDSFCLQDRCLLETTTLQDCTTRSCPDVVSDCGW